MKNPSYVYIMTNYEETTLYVGVTSNLIQRVYTHKEKINDGFTKKYNLSKLVYYEECPDVEQAILREKQIKGGSRKKKLDLVTKSNPNWDDLWNSIVG